MNKMDEIKERLENVSTKRGVDLFHARNAFDTHSEDDIDYLLSIIEQAEKVLTYYAEESYLAPLGYSDQAIEALKAIRGN